MRVEVFSRVVVGVVVASAVGVAYAAIPDSGGTVHACTRTSPRRTSRSSCWTRPRRRRARAGGSRYLEPEGAARHSRNPGCAGVSGYTTVSAFGGNQKSAEADCPAGKVPLGGGLTTPVSVPAPWTTQQDAPVYVRNGSNIVIGGGWSASLLAANVDTSFGTNFKLTVYVNRATAN